MVFVLHCICTGVVINAVFCRNVTHAVRMWSLKALFYWRQKDWKTKVGSKKKKVLKGSERLLGPSQVEVSAAVTFQQHFKSVLGSCLLALSITLPHSCKCSYHASPCSTALCSWLLTIM